jgi:hypothetical protein
VAYPIDAVVAVVDSAGRLLRVTETGAVALDPLVVVGAVVVLVDEVLPLDVLVVLVRWRQRSAVIIVESSDDDCAPMVVLVVSTAVPTSPVDPPPQAASAPANADNPT